MSSIEQAVIFCGGLGSRLMPLTKKIPKPMVKVNNEPFLKHLLDQCKSNGIKNFLFLCGYKHEKIINYFGSGKKFGVKIEYHYNSPNIETYKRIYEARGKLRNIFLLLYADNYASLNLNDLIDKFNKNKSNFIISICNKKKGNILINIKNSKISKYYFKKNNKSNYVDIGYMILHKKIILKNYTSRNISFNYLIDKLVKQKKIHYYYNDTNYLSISDLKRYKNTKKNFTDKYVLIDRDGVLNKKNNKHYYVRNLKELRINYPFIKKLKKIIKNKKLICITNQAGIATKDVKKVQLQKINSKIKLELKKFKIDLVDFFVCEDHFNSQSFFRKPNHGLFLMASKKYKIVLDRTFYIGDDLRDIEASYRAKTKCMYVGNDKLSDKLKKKYINTLV